MEQMYFKNLMYMSKNEFAIPEIDGCKREFAVNGALLLARAKHKVTGHKREDLFKRQYFLAHRIRNLERQ